MIKAFDHLPINVGLTGKGNNSHPFGLVEQIEAGAIGLKLHEDWGATHVAIDTCLDVCEKYDVQSTLHTDTMNECGYVGDTEKSIRNRTIHSYHTEGAGGGHAPDIIAVVKNNHILPASTNPTRPYTFNTTDEHLDMVMVAHHLSKDIPADVSFAESRIHAETMAAEDCLLDDGSISIMSSDSLAMGRIGEVVLRTWTSANKMAVGAQTSDLRDALEKNQLDEDKVLQETLKVVHPTPSKPSKPGIPQPPKPGIPQPPEPQLPIVNNFRVKRYIAKYTINPALAHGMSHLIGSVEEKKFADLVIWQPSNFGTKPDLVLKGGMIAVALGGDPNGSIPTIEPKIMRPRFATYVPETSITFVSKMSVEPIGSTQPATSPPPKLSPGAPPTTIKKGSKIEEYGLKKRVEYVQGCRVIKKTHMIHNDTMPESIEVDPETFVVSQVVDGKVIPYDAPPATSVPLAQDYFVC
ncbi:unnamed protein product [Penicillium nalgiovense]|nr:unnamed protein product [Penicillium nalgiovense]